MEDTSSSGLTDRQLFALEYLEYTKKVILETDESMEGKQFSIQLHGKAKEPPEIDDINFGNGYMAVVIYHDLDKFLITNMKSGKQIDLVVITPLE